MGRKGKPLNPALLPTAALSLAGFVGLTLLLGDQMAQGKDPKVKPERKPQRPVKTIIKHKVITKKIVVWKTPKPKTQPSSAPTESYSAPTESYSAPAQSYSAPAQTYSAPAQPSPAPSVQSGSS